MAMVRPTMSPGAPSRCQKAWLTIATGGFDGSLSAGSEDTPGDGLDAQRREEGWRHLESFQPRRRVGERRRARVRNHGRESGERFGRREVGDVR